MSPEMARAAVDFAFSTPRPTIRLEIVGAEGAGRQAGWLAVEYARRKAEWRGRGLALSWRTARRPAAEQSAWLAANRVEVVADVRAVGGPERSQLFPAARARVRLARGAACPESWIDALASLGVSQVSWEPDVVATDWPAPGSARRVAKFAARALARLIETHERSGLRDERAVALLSFRPWEIPGTDLLSTLAYSPEGGIYSSEAGYRRAEEENNSRRLGFFEVTRFSQFASMPTVQAILAAAWRAGHPECSDCPYREQCSLPWSRKSCGRGGPAHAWCALHTALMRGIFSYPDREKCISALNKWGVDISRIAW